MASGLYNKIVLTPSTDTVLVNGTSMIASSKVAVLTVNLCNQNTGVGSNTTVRLGISTGNTLANTDYLEYETPLNGSGVLERTGIVLVPGYNLIARSATANVSALAYGVEA